MMAFPKMARTVSTVVLTLLLVLPALGCDPYGGTSEFEIQVRGTDGLGFSGNYMVMRSDGQSTQRSVDGTVPASYRVEGSIVSVSFQKSGEGGMLSVVIERDGRAVARESTTAAYGVVSVATQ